MKTALIIIGVIVLMLLFMGAKYVHVHNELVVEREAIKGQWAQVESAMQRRADLIPNLVATVKGFAGHETEVFKNIADARAALGGARSPQDKIAANDQLNSAVSRLLVVVENYPQLKSGENFLHLQDDLSSTENRVNIERRKYNEALETYNASLQLFPDNIVASMSGFTRNDAYFHTDAGADKAPKVQF